MKKNILISLLVFNITVRAQQNESVEKSIYNFQIGTVGAWFNNETKLANQFALRTEVGLYTESQVAIGFFMAPEFTLEPRWYYNIEKRAFKGLNTNNNAANFFTVKLNHRSDIFEIGNYNYDRSENSISIIPKWGIRRNLGKYFNYEAGIGIGYIQFINQKYFKTFDNNGIFIDLHFRIGLNL